MKYSESHSGNRYGVTIFNYLTGLVISLLLLRGRSLYVPTEAGRFALFLSVLNGFLFVVCLLLLQYSIRKNGAPMTATFNRLGILIPTLSSAFLFHEIPSALKSAGLALAIFSIVYMNGRKEKSGASGVNVSLLLLFAAGGLVDLASKVFGIYGDSALQEHFIFYTFLFALIMSVGICLKENRVITKQDVVAGILVGIPNQLTALCLLKAVALLPAYMVFPVQSAAVILVVNAVNFLVFHEVLSRREYIGTGIIATALVLINL